MYCPACGKVNSTDQRYCRACGLSLESIVKSFQEVLPAGAREKDLQARTQQVERWLVAVGGTAAAFFLGLIFYKIIVTLIILKGEVLKGSILIAFLLGMVTVGLLAIYRDYLAKKAKEAKSQLTSGADTSRLLDNPRFEPASSITDRTTELLKVERSRRVTVPTDINQN